MRLSTPHAWKFAHVMDVDAANHADILVVPRIRSKDGCLTCRRRKVRCDQEQPRCSHCERLNLQCRWRAQPSIRESRVASQDRVITSRPSDSQASDRIHDMDRSDLTNTSLRSPSTLTASDTSTATRVCDGNLPSTSAGMPTEASVDTARSSYVDQGFTAQQPIDGNLDYTTFMWTGGDWWNALDAHPFPSNLADILSLPAWDSTQDLNNWNLESTSDIASSPASLGLVAGEHDSTGDTPTSPVQALGSEDQKVLENFSRSSLPPILTAIETKQRWCHVKQSLIRMTEGSSLVRAAVLAFSNLSMRQSGNKSLMTLPAEHYQNAAHLLDQKKTVFTISNKQNRKEILATASSLPMSIYLRVRWYKHRRC